MNDFDGVIEEYYSLSKFTGNAFEKMFLKIFGVPVLGKNIRYGLFKIYAEDNNLGGGCALDFGAGSGEIAIYLAKNGFSVDIVDLKETYFNHILSYSRLYGLDVSCFKTYGPRIHYDLIVCLSVLDYLEEPELEIVRLINLLNENGKIVISIPNERRKLSKNWMNIINTKYINKGFDIKNFDELMLRNGLIKLWERDYLPCNIYKVYDFIDKKISIKMLAALNFTVFLLLNKILSIFLAAYGTETFLVYEKLISEKNK